MKLKLTFVTTAAAILLSLTAGAQIKYTWTCVPMDSKFDEITDLTATNIIAKYSPLMEPLYEIIGYSDAEYDKTRPESGLSDFAADAVREAGEKICGEKVDIGLTNFGGIRTSLPKGAIRVYDIYSIFPFQNNVVVFDIKGSDLIKFFKRMARRTEALSGVYFVARNGKPETMIAGGRPVVADQIYKMATINFLLDGGDGVVLREVAMNMIDSDILIRDAVISRIKEKCAAGKPLHMEKDGRVTIINTEEAK